MTTTVDLETVEPRPMRRWGLGVAICLLPLIVILMTPARSNGPLLYVGLLPAIVALTSGPRVAALTALATGASVFVGLLLSSMPLAAAVFMVGLGLAVAWSYRHGWQGAVTYVATQGALAAIAAPRSGLTSPDLPASSLASAAGVAAIVLAGGLWVALVGQLLLGDVPRSHHEVPSDRDLRTFAVALCLSVGIGTYLIMIWAPASNAWWIILTLLVVLQPHPEHTLTRGLARAGGTVLGGVLAAVAVVVIDSATVLGLLGVTMAVASAVSYIRAPYWVFAATLTMTLVLVSMPPGQRLRGDLERIGFTVLAAALAVAVSLAVQALARRVPDPSA